MSDDQAEIKEYVRQRYGERARQVSQLTVLSVEDAVCCADGTSSTDMDGSLGAFSNLYIQSELEGLPVEAVAASAGCGNPTALAGLKAGERVLDLGSGGGIDCFLAARQVGPQGHVIGLDMTPDMLALARRNAETLGVSNVEFVDGYIEDIPLPESSVDVVISNCVVCLSPDKNAVASDSGGQFVVLGVSPTTTQVTALILVYDGPDAEGVPEKVVGEARGQFYADSVSIIVALPVIIL